MRENTARGYASPSKSARRRSSPRVRDARTARDHGVLVTGLVVPLTAIVVLSLIQGSDLSAALTFASLGLLTVGLGLGVAALVPAERTDRVAMKPSSCSWRMQLSRPASSSWRRTPHT